MLILKRKVGQTINVGDDIEIAVMGIDGYHVKVGIKAPKDVPVHREEIYKRIKTREEQNSPQISEVVSIYS